MNMDNISIQGYESNPFISDIRKKKIASYKNKKDQVLSFGCELLLNRAIKDLDASIALPVNYAYDGSGRPFLISLPYFISFSHSGTLAALAISDKKVGIDIQIMEKCNYDRISKRFFSSVENNSVHNIGDFYSYWCLKEAYTKFLGLGMRKSFKSFTVDIRKPLTDSYYQYELDYDKAYKCFIVSKEKENIEKYFI